MPARSVIAQLPPNLREWFEQELVRRNFGDYSAIVEELNERLCAEGLELAVSRSSAHRYGQTFEEKIVALKETTQIARAIAKEVGDDEGHLNGGVTRLVQDKLFRLVAHGDLELKDVVKVGHVVADLGRASIAQNKHQITMKERAARVADDVSKRATQGGLSEEAAEQIRRDIMGIVDGGAKQ